jgi:hypothetical protein
MMRRGTIYTNEKYNISSPKKLYHFKKGDIVEWTDDKIRHEGEIIEGTKISVMHRGKMCKVRTNYFQVKSLADGSLFVVHGSRLSKTKMRVGFS